MLHTEGKPRCLEGEDASAAEPCYKKPKSNKEPYGKSYDGLQNLYEEVHITKTHSGFIPLSLSNDEDGEDETAEDPVISKGVSLCRNPATYKPSNSVNNTEFTGNKYSLSINTAVVNNRKNNESPGEHADKGDSQLFSTSEAFIGPIYKSEAVQQAEKKKTDTNKNHQKPKAMRGGNCMKEVAPKQSLCDIAKIDDELSQFYSEIHQLEHDENVMDTAERDSHKQPVEYNRWNHIECINSQNWPDSKTTSICNGGQCFYSESSNHGIGSELNPYNGQLGHRTGNGESFGSERNTWEAGRLCNKQANSRFWNDSVPQFEPGWKETHPFIIPYGPSPPQFIPNFQGPLSSLHHSNNFQFSHVGPFKNTQINMKFSPSDTNSETANYSGTRGIETNQDGYSVHEGHIGNSFCENRMRWNDTQQSRGASNVSQQFMEGNLCEPQKLLLILRGLPGSGKTTLSRILLDQSRDGIVFSTDDYFCQQDGYWSYNIGQLGAAHDWNQKRARQAMDQGRSPVIIDNTNTQAWEMKPYVEAALEKCYRVEFHEPDTWWKFDPEELEKRNKHGVTREKIIQMMERYEYQISIPIVMNSVLPFHKTSQRPPPERRQRETVAKKKHKLHKMKHRRKRKRSRKMKGAAVKVVEKSRPLTPSDKDWSQSGDEDSEDNGKFALDIDGYLKEFTGDNEVDSACESGPKHSDVQKGCFCVSGVVNPVTADESVKNDVLSGDNCPSSMSLPFVPNESITELSSSDYLPAEIKNKNLVETKNNILEVKNQSSTPKSDYSNAENNPVLSNMEDKAVLIKAVSELGTCSKLLDNKDEVSVFHHQETSQKIERNTWAFFSFELADEQSHSNFDKSETCVTWPESASEFIYEQRTRKSRKPKPVFSEKTKELGDDKPNKELEKESERAMSNEGDNRIDSSLPSLLPEVPSIETSNFPTESLTRDSDSRDKALLVSPTRKGRCRRIFNLAPNFDLPRQLPDRKSEKGLRDEGVLTEQEEVRDEGIRGTGTSTHDSLASSGHAIVVDSLPPDVESLLCGPVPTNLTEPVISPNTAVASPVHIHASTPSPSEGQTVTPDKTVQINTDRNEEEMSSDISTIQPDILYSINATNECLRDAAAETSENMHQMGEFGTTKCSQIEDDQDILSTNAGFLRLPLSLGFALQLVELFGSPAVPIDTLLPDDFVVPLDWTLSKEIYLRWNAALEKTQKKDRSKEHNSLPAGDSNEASDQEKEGSSDVSPQMHLFQ